ncbi:MAG: PA14 domain-containing protein, partial [Solirubrobacterales bacterium]
MFRKCVSMAALCLTLALAGSVNAQLGQGKVLFEFWDNIGGGTNVDNDLRTNANFPDNPSSSIWADNFQSPSGRADNYGVRGRAFVIPPETGEYTFWVAGDDNCQLWLSTNEDPANATMIAQVASWTGVAEWTKEAGQKSAPVSLVAGQKYYLEGLMKEGGGGDSLDVGWAGPGIGDAPVVLAGQYCTAFIRTPEPIVMASSPKPADGATDVMGPTFEWTAGINAVQHSIYFGTTPELTAADLKNTWAVAMYYHMGELVPGTTYYWRVDEIDAEGNVYTGNTWSFTATPFEAHSPIPADGAKNMGRDTTVAWTVGLTAVSQIVYFGADQAAVAAGDAAVQVATIGDIATTSFVPAAELDLFTTYYWRVDQIDAAGAVIAGPVWSFSTIEYLPIVETATALNYDNAAEPFITTLDVAVPADITNAGALGEMVINFTGRTAPTGGVSYDEATATYSVTGAGADIWGTADQFEYAYKTLNGDGTMIARVVSVGTGSSEWSKGGVMIRQSLAAGSTHAFMPITGPSATTASGGNGASFQRRLVADSDSSNNDSSVRIDAPYFVKIERVGDAFTGSVSADGVEWTQLGDPQTIAMGNPVYIGLAVTSHTSGELRTFTFDNVATTGDVTPEGLFEACDDIGLASNDPAVMTVTITDAAGAVAAVSNGDPAAIQNSAAQNWKLLLSDFVGVDLTNVASLSLSVGDGQVGGAGTVTFNSIATMPVEALVDVTSPADAVVGVPDDGLQDGSGNFGWPAAELPAYAFDDNTATKFLHFKGEIEATGAIITPAGSTVVKGLSFTTANDAPER